MNIKPVSNERALHLPLKLRHNVKCFEPQEVLNATQPIVTVSLPLFRLLDPEAL